jgi:hypothetical protein
MEERDIMSISSHKEQVSVLDCGKMHIGYPVHSIL